MLYLGQGTLTLCSQVLQTILLILQSVCLLLFKMYGGGQILTCVLIQSYREVGVASFDSALGTGSWCSSFK